MEEIELKHVPNMESAKIEERIALTETTCFLCRSNYNYSNYQNNHENTLIPGIVDDKVSLLRISRYLKLELIPSGKNSEELVRLCQGCTPIVENLSNLLEQLETVQMKVDYTLGEFRNILKTSEKVAADQHAPLIKQCNKRLNAVLPKVIIEDTHDKKKTVKTTNLTKPSQLSNQQSPSLADTELFPERPKKPWQCNSCPASFSQRRNLDAHRRTIHGESYSCPRCHSKFDKRSDYTQHKNFDCPNLPSKSITPGQQTCTLCIPPKTISAGNWRRHTIRKHIETLFKSYQEPNLSQENFKLYCDHVFKMQQISQKRCKNSDKVCTRKCSHCPNKFTNQNLLRSHLFHAHKNIVTKLIIATQKNLTLEQIKNRTDLPKIPLSDDENDKVETAADLPQNNTQTGFFTCIFCRPNQKINMCSKSKHNARFHVDMIFATVKSPTMTQRDFKYYCEYLFTAEIKSFRMVPNEDYIHAKSRIECAHCLKTLCDKKAMRIHLSAYHKAILKEKLVKLQNTVGIKEILEKGEILQSSVKIPKRKYEQMGRKCTECGRMISTECNLRRHMKVVHKMEATKVEGNGERDKIGDQTEIVEKMETVEDGFEHSALFVTKVDVSSFQQSGVNYVEMTEEFNCDDEYFVETDNQGEDIQVKY